MTVMTAMTATATAQTLSTDIQVYKVEILSFLRLKLHLKRMDQLLCFSNHFNYILISNFSIFSS